MAQRLLTLDHVASNSVLFRRPRIVAFNRLETRPRTRDFTRSLRAEVRDPLWMLTRQWQFGEFKGEDAASCVTSRIAYQHEVIDRVSLREGSAFSFDAEAMPLETRVEREEIPLTVRETAGNVFSDVLLAIKWGKEFLRILKAAGGSLEADYQLYLAKFAIRVLPAPGSAGSPPDAEAEQLRVAVENRVADGIAIVRSVRKGTHDPWIDTQSASDPGALKTIAADFAAARSAALKRLFTQPDDSADSAWLQNRLEYRFSVAAPQSANRTQTVLLAEQFHQGRLDWYSFDSVTDRSVSLDAEAEPASISDQTESFLPANVRFKGQPRARFWEMEETQTDFGKIETSTTGLLHLMLAEFGLIYSNDWFMLPHPMTTNTVCEIRGIVVDDTFGRHTFIRPAGRGPETAWQRWSMFHLTEKNKTDNAANRFYLVPAVGKTLESDPLERVNFIRDEMANMVWGVESVVPSQVGRGMSGGGSAIVPSDGSTSEPPSDLDAKIRYLLGTRVPRNWIPFIPVHAEGSVSEIRLQRARMVGGDPPRGQLLREPRSPYFVEEEEVTRAGAFVERSWQRARWIDGRTFIWIGRRKTAGRGEGSSQLRFDQIIDLSEPPPT